MPMSRLVLESFAGFPAYLLYFTTAMALLAAFIASYVRITPYHEVALIREGNTAAAISLGGATLGFIFPLHSAISHSGHLVDVALWGVLSGAIQLTVFWVTSKIFHRLTERIPDDCQAHAVYLAAISISAGLLSAACMIP